MLRDPHARSGHPPAGPPPVGGLPLAVGLRLARAGAFAAVMTALAGSAHAAAGGMAPGPAVTAGALLAVAAAAYPGTRRERGLPAVLGWTAACQAGLHLLFELAMVASCAAPAAAGATAHIGVAGATGHMGAMAATGPVAGPAGAAAGGCAATTWTGLVTGHAPGWMVLAHAGAAVAAAWWLRRGERLAVRLLSLLPALAAPLLAVVLVAAHRLGNGLPDRLSETGGAPWTDRDARGPTGSSPAADPVSRRGPPLPAAA